MKSIHINDHIADQLVSLAEAKNCSVDELLANFIASENKTTPQQASAESNITETFLHIVSTVHQNLNLNEIYTEILEQLALIVPYTTASIALVENEKVHFIALKGFPNTLDSTGIEAILNTDEHWKKVFTDEIVIRGNVQEDEDWVSTDQTQAYVRSWLGVRLIYRDKTVGVLNIDHTEADFYTPHHAQLALGFAQLVAGAIENARLFSNLENEVHTQNKALQEREERLSIILDLMSDYVYFAKMHPDDTLELDWIVGPFEEVTTYSVEEIKAMEYQWASVLHPDDLAKFSNNSDELRSQKNLIYEYRIFTKTGEIRWVRDYIRPMWVENDLVGLLGAVQDITESKHIENALIESEKRYRRLVENIGDDYFIYGHDLDGQYYYVNSAVRELFGLNPSQIINRKLRDILDLESQSQRLLLANHAIAQQGQTPPTYEIEYQHPDSSIRVLEISEHPIFAKDGTAVGIEGIAKDITDRRQLDTMKRQFIANAAHDLANPITILRIHLYIMQTQPDKFAENFTVLENQINRLSELTNDLLYVSRLERQILELKLTPLNINDLLYPIIEAQRLMAESKNLQLNATIDDNLSLIDGDQIQLDRVIVNLVANAINYTMEGHIFVSTEQIDHWVVLTVHDTGIGIPAEDLDKIFEQFYRSRPSEKIAQGTGLGLYIAQNIVERHQGYIEVNSTFGAGSTFKVFLPIIPA